jgi:hypothetical protein
MLDDPLSAFHRSVKLQSLTTQKVLATLTLLRISHLCCREKSWSMAMVVLKKSGLHACHAVLPVLDNDV